MYFAKVASTPKQSEIMPLKLLRNVVESYFIFILKTSCSGIDTGLSKRPLLWLCILICFFRTNKCQPMFYLRYTRSYALSQDSEQFL